MPPKHKDTKTNKRLMFKIFILVKFSDFVL
jgi:hypothetical protein